VAEAVFPYIGGKAYTAEWIASLLPPPGAYRTFVDLFGGAANVLLAVMRASGGRTDIVWVYSDIDGELVNFFRVLRDPELGPRLIEAVRLTPYSRREYRECLLGPPEDPVERARRFYVVTAQSYAGKPLGAATPGAWGYSIRESNREAQIRRWASAPERLRRFALALRGVQVECLDFRDAIRRYDTPETLFYADPPYHPATRCPRMYRHEMTREDHRELAELLHGIRGMAVVSGYRCRDYDAWYAGWERRDALAVCYSSGVGAVGKLKGLPRPRRVESLWLSPAAVRAGAGGAREMTFDLEVT
jgi:DNA adenine methylase